VAVATLAFQQSGFAKHPKVVADRRLMLIELTGEAPHAGLSSRVGQHNARWSQSDGVRHRLETLRALFGVTA
jgi:hypothetical protein